MTSRGGFGTLDWHRLTSVLVLSTQMEVGDVLQLPRLSPVKFLDVQVLAADDFLQLLDVFLQLSHLLLTRHWSLDRKKTLHFLSVLSFSRSLHIYCIYGWMYKVPKKCVLILNNYKLGVYYHLFYWQHVKELTNIILSFCHRLFCS